MKYLKIFEAFKSSLISNIIKFLKGKKINSSYFLKDLSKVMKVYGLPISEIQESDVKYLNKSAALKVRNNYEVHNDKDIYCLKFWFSLESGYCGYTGVGNSVIPYRSGLKFTESELEYIKNNIIDVGRLVKFERGSRYLKHGDMIIFIAGKYDELSSITMARIWNKGGDRICAIHNNPAKSGGEPYEIGWREFGNFSWTLAEGDVDLTDHSKIHIYTNSSDPIDGDYLSSNPDLVYNLQLGHDFNFIGWQSSSSMLKDISDCDFALVLMIDDMLKRGFKSTHDIKKERHLLKSGSLSFMTDKEVISMNYKKYMIELLSRMGVSKNSSINDVKNLQKIILKSLCGKFAFFSIICEFPGLRLCNSMAIGIYDFLINGGKNIDDLVSDYCSLVYNFKSYNILYNKVLSAMMESDDQKMIEFVNIFLEIGEDINEYVKKNDINTLDQFKAVNLKLESIKSLFNSNELKFENYNFLKDFIYHRVASRIALYNTEDIDKDIQKAHLFKKRVKTFI